MTYKHLFPVFLHLCVGVALHGQSIVVSDGINIRNDYGYEIIGRLKDRVLLFRDRYDNYEIQAFDGQLRASWNRELEDLSKQNTKVISVLGGKNDFSIIYSIRVRGKYYLRIHKYDPAAVLIDTATIKIFGERPFTPPLIDVSVSEDKNTVVLYNLAEKDKIEAVCFRIDQMKVLWDKTANFETDLTERALAGLAISNDGAFFIVTEYENRKAKIEQHRFQVLRISAGQDEIRRIVFPDALTTDCKFIYNNRHRQLVGVGLWGEKNKERANGAFFTKVDFANNTTTQVHKTVFDDQFLSILRNKDVAGDSKGIDEADVAQIILRDDGGAAMVVERHYEIQRGTGSPSRLMREMRTIVDHYYDDVFLLGFGPDGQVQWNSVLHKKQYSQDDDAVFSSYFLMRGPTHLQFLFNDEIRYENSCSEYEVLPTGAFDRNSLMSTVNKGLRLRFRDGVQISANECLIPSEYRSKLKLVAIKY